METIANRLERKWNEMSGVYRDQDGFYSQLFVTRFRKTCCDLCVDITDTSLESDDSPECYDFADGSNLIIANPRQRHFHTFVF
jgi:hypothetical protein